jgi:hypothetical protein
VRSGGGMGCGREDRYAAASRTCPTDDHEPMVSAGAAVVRLHALRALDGGERGSGFGTRPTLPLVGRRSWCAVAAIPDAVAVVSGAVSRRECGLLSLH